MAEEKPTGKSLKLKKDAGDAAGKAEVSKAAAKRPAAETPERKEKPGTKESVRSSFGKSLVKVGKEFAKSNGREQDGKVASKDGKGAVKEEAKSPAKESSKGGKVYVKQEGRVSVKEEVKSPVKGASKGGKVSVKEEGNANGKEQGKGVSKGAGKVNGKEQGKKVNGKDSGGARDLGKAKEEGRDRDGEKEKGKSSVVKKSPVSTPVKPGSATKASTKSTKVSHRFVQIFCEGSFLLLRHVEFLLGQTLLSLYDFLSSSGLIVE